MRRTILLALLLFLPISATAQSLYVRETETGYLNLRDGPGTRHDVLRRLSPGDRVEVEETMGRWARVRGPSGNRGWVSSDYLERAPRATGDPLFVALPGGGHLNLRAGAGTGHPILRRIYAGDRLVPLGRQGDWIRVRHATGAIGWVHGAYVSR
ncbi:SH3 domain-containing protein [Jannaschia sp. S6380]|uniref:SH3 domain-containing protein n=1 Tax=Jannaschia sp. S6380 TaxID=2926408 RepID=UPI001FF38B0D|nr:SH3 domain-containing protein [Jannaschia sp. S6380]MCK0166955.1 SH3 domain-containing protein [Jannaschia sp. S6380]